MNDDRNIKIYNKLLKVLDKHKIDKKILNICYINTVIMHKIRILANLYIVIDRYVKGINNQYYKNLLKKWINKQYYDENIKDEAKKYMSKLLTKGSGVDNIYNIDYKYDENTLERYVNFLMSDFFITVPLEQSSVRTPNVAVSEKSSKGDVCKVCKTVPCVCKETKKPNYKDIVNTGVMDVKKDVTYNHLLDKLNIYNKADRDIINEFWNDFQNQQSLKNKKSYYLYIVYLVTNIKFSDIIINFVTEGVDMIDGIKVKHNILEKFNSFFINNNEYNEFRQKHEYNTYIKIKFKDNFIRNYLSIKPSKNKQLYIDKVISSIRNKIRNIDVSAYIDKNYINKKMQTVDSKYELEDVFYKEIANEIQQKINNNKINNKIVIINMLYQIMPDAKKKEIVDNTEVYYYT